MIKEYLLDKRHVILHIFSIDNVAFSDCCSKTGVISFFVTYGNGVTYLNKRVN